MKFKFYILLSTLFLFENIKAQNLDWGSLMAIDKSVSIVVAKMEVEDLKKGIGTLIISKIIKGDSTLSKVKVQFSEQITRKENTKQEDAPTYYYTKGQEGIWLLVNLTSQNRFDLRNASLYYNKKWESKIIENINYLNKRKWSTAVNGVSGSVIVDSIGANKLYRFFYFCLRNDSDSTVFINTHYRIQHSEHINFTANLITPTNQKIDMIKGGNNDCRLAGEPGWPHPIPNDFKELKPGQKIYLLGSGDLRCFYKNPPRGDFEFKSSYQNNTRLDIINGKCWLGEIVFPSIKFNYFPIEKVKKINFEQKSQSEKTYESLISVADSCFSKREFECAKKNYQNALSVKPKEKYPNQQIIEINRIEQNKQPGNLLEVKYNRAIQKADDFFKEKDYKKAKTAYQEASDIKPDEAYPTSQIQKIKYLEKK